MSAARIREKRIETNNDGLHKVNVAHLSVLEELVDPVLVGVVVAASVLLAVPVE